MLIFLNNHNVYDILQTCLQVKSESVKQSLKVAGKQITEYNTKAIK